MPSFERGSVVRAQEISRKSPTLSTSPIINTSQELTLSPELAKNNSTNIPAANPITYPYHEISLTTTIRPTRQSRQLPPCNIRSTRVAILYSWSLMHLQRQHPTFHPEPSPLYSQDEALGFSSKWITALAGGIGTVAAL